MTRHDEHRPAAAGHAWSFYNTMSDDTLCLTDSKGHQFKPHEGQARIVSMTDPLTDLVLALELGDQLVGHVTRPSRIPDSRDIGSVLLPDLERITSLEPSHVLVHPTRTPQAIQDHLMEKGLQVVAMAPATVQDNFGLFCFFGELFGVKDNADTLSRRFEAGLARVKMAMHTMPVKRVLYIDNHTPFLTIAKDSYVASLFEIIHILPVQASDGGIVLTDIPDSMLMSIDKVLFNGAPGLFRPADIAQFAKSHNIDMNRLHRLDVDPAQQIGVRAIEMLETLPDLRKALDHTA